MNEQSPSGLGALAERVLCVGWGWGVAVPVPVSVLPCLRGEELSLRSLPSSWLEISSYSRFTIPTRNTGFSFSVASIS